MKRNINNHIKDVITHQRRQMINRLGNTGILKNMKLISMAGPLMLFSIKEYIETLILNHHEKKY